MGDKVKYYENITAKTLCVGSKYEGTSGLLVNQPSEFREKVTIHKDLTVLGNFELPDSFIPDNLIIKGSATIPKNIIGQNVVSSS